ncbi:polysaccharide deacetylase family protein [Bradyrhizobium erythrophlei]|uniref:Chitooligosaccharide deacetylase n=1 Tax=Bradyrhizobium erythrophlei TaxID=1437360 RepID=A0A1M5T905_9BRAD|nr:polysaccharide deacetylase family protein [Bradyrhizobium erythrophlei]SHH47255.1 Peptidoglycan/xylan/chitin deacetylase, PgdA/CDA1 family [Bradyrhizobium erythrophlei]
MIGRVLVGLRTWQCAALYLMLLTGIGAQAASAADCPGHPDALGTSRTLVVDPREHPRIGTMQYPETLPLADHEVVLTFDDGPLPHNSNQVLDILAAECVKATFFEIGRMATAYPEGVRKLRDAGHTIGTHSQNHPLTMNRMPIERARQEIDDGIASVKAALGDDAALSPFFRIPGLMRAQGVEDYLASQGIQVWSADFLADDWRHISSSRVYDLAMQRLEAKGRGILLLHDIQARTVAALPRILRELKARGYRIVHVVPETPQLPATSTEPPQWQLHPPSENVAISHWPKIPNFVFAEAEILPAPSLSDLDWQDEQSMTLAESLDHAGRLARGVPLPREAPWPRQLPMPLDGAATVLPVPAGNIFEIPEKSFAAIALASPRQQQTAPAGHETDRIAKLIAADSGQSRRTIPRKRFGRRGAPRLAGRGNGLAARGGRRELKHLVQVKKRSV